MEEIKEIIQSLVIKPEEKEQLLKEIKSFQKKVDSFEFKYKRTLIDKEAITNILNASIEEIEKQKSVINKQKREALNRASIDRVRAEIASMRTATDLEKITPLIWDELTILNIPFIRSGIILVHEDDDEKVEIYLSTPEGKAIASFIIPASKTEFSQKIFSHWKSKQILIEHWDEKVFFAWAKNLVDLGVIKSEEQYLTANPPQTLYLHFLPFAQGMLYVGNTSQLLEEDINLIQSLVTAFSTAYARYDDFNKLEEAKQKVENTLRELRSAQQQLIQSEKMASLGQLTAGIAHEINNPINFVSANIKPLKEDLADILECIHAYENTVKENKLEDVFAGVQQYKAKLDIHVSMKEVNDLLRGIEEGASRTSEIVKGLRNFSRLDQNDLKKADLNEGIESTLMLLHSIYKDRVEIVKVFGKIPEVECFPGQINQVFMNILSNAIQAIPESGTIFIKTWQHGDSVKTSMRDTGSGMPEATRKKIFDPFFTTKDVGKGTGLGLSISYGIIEKHKGKIEVNSEVGEGTEFIITLPIYQN